MTGWIRTVLAVILVVLVTLAILPFQLLALWIRHPWRKRLPRCWHRATLWAIGVKVKVHGSIEGRRPLLIAANHASWLDILVLGSVADVTYVAKAEVKGWPVFGLLARLQRTIFIEREQRRQTQNQANVMSDRLLAGEAVVLFPEGTTSDGNRLYEMKSSLFAAATGAAALSAGGTVHVQPVSIAYTRIHGMAMGHYHRPIAAWPGDVPLLPHLLGVLKEGAIDAEVGFGEAVDVSSKSNRKEISAYAEREIRRMLEDRLRGR